MIYKVGNKEFKTFHDIEVWAWNEYKIELLEKCAEETDEEFAVAQLNNFINKLERGEDL